MNTMARLEARDRVKRAIVDPVRERWVLPRGTDEETLIGDFHQDLGEFDEPTLHSAFTAIRRSWGKSIWPPASEFSKACSIRHKAAIAPGQVAREDKTGKYAQMRREIAEEGAKIVNAAAFKSAGEPSEGG